LQTGSVSETSNMSVNRSHSAYTTVVEHTMICSLTDALQFCCLNSSMLSVTHYIYLLKGHPFQTCSLYSFIRNSGPAFLDRLRPNIAENYYWAARESLQVYVYSFLSKISVL